MLSKERLFDLKNQILMAEKINSEEIEPIMIEATERYMGRYIPKYGYTWDIMINEIYPIIQTNLPSIFFRNPRAFLKPRNKTYIAKKFDPVAGRKVETQMDSQKSANTQEAILNYSLEEIKYKREVRKVLMDALLFPHGVLWHGYKGDFGMTEEQSLFVKDDMVFVKRICPMRFIKDPNVNFSNLDEAKWVGRIIDMPFLDLIEDDKLDVDPRLIKGFKGYGQRVGTASVMASGLDTYQTGGQDTVRINNLKKNLLDFTEDGFKNSHMARFVRCYELYIRPTKKEKRDGSRGTILLFTHEQPKPLRENEWTVKAEGFPVQLLQFNELNDAMLGIADIDTYKTIADQKNIMTNIMIRNAQENSKVYVALASDGTSEEDIQKVQRGDQTILIFKGDTVNGKMSVQSGGGGASSELYMLEPRLQKNLEDKSGITDQRKGVLQSGEESAASVKIRAVASSARPAYRQDIMGDFIKDSFKYINQLLKQFLPFDDAVRIVGSLDLEWSESPTIEDVQADVDIEIDPISMLPEQPEDELAKLQQILQLMVESISNPAISQKLAQEGKTIELSPIIEQILIRLKIRDPDIFRNIKPEESQGFVSVEQLREAKENVNAALTGAEVPYPPKKEDDHLAKLEIYSTIKDLLEKAGQVSDMLEQLMQIQSAMLQEHQEEQANVGQKMNKKPFMVTT